MIIGLIQVRMGSSRLPGKSLMDIHGKPMLWHLWKRVQNAKLLDRIVIATTTQPQDDQIATFAAQHNIDCYRGSEMDIMTRLADATRTFGGTAFVRITGDCPLIDPALIDKTIAFHKEAPDFDIITNIFPPTHPQGLSVELITLDAMDRAINETSDPLWREWATVYFYEHARAGECGRSAPLSAEANATEGSNLPGYRIKNLEHPENLGHHRWTVDYEEDAMFMKAVFGALGPAGEPFTMQEILTYLEKHTEVYNLNRKFKRNEAFGEVLKEKGLESEWYKTQ